MSLDGRQCGNANSNKLDSHGRSCFFYFLRTGLTCATSCACMSLLCHLLSVPPPLSCIMWCRLLGSTIGWHEIGVVYGVHFLQFEAAWTFFGERYVDIITIMFVPPLSLLLLIETSKISRFDIRGPSAEMKPSFRNLFEGVGFVGFVGRLNSLTCTRGSVYCLQNLGFHLRWRLKCVIG